MADDKSSRGPQYLSRISLGDDYEVRYWTDKFGISNSLLEGVVRSVGASASAVEEELRKRTLTAGGT